MTDRGVANHIRTQLTLRSPAGLPSLELYTAHARSDLRSVARGGNPYWAFPWPGGVALACFLLQNRGVAVGKRVLDLGCGGGLAGIAAAKAGAAAVYAFDTDPVARVAAELNAQANGVQLAVLPKFALPQPGIDLVLAGDVFYAASVARRMIACLRRCRETAGAVLVGDVGREYLPRGLLRELAHFPVKEFGGGWTTGSVFVFEP